MMKRLPVLLLALLCSKSAYAGTLVITSDDNNLVPLEWEYKEIATRQWLPGCSWWDFLQASGWFPATWFSYYTPSAEATSYRFETRSTWARRYCGSSLNEYNHVRMNYTDVVNGTVYEGSFRVIPGGANNHVNIQCWIDDSNDYGRPLQCENPTVDWDDRDTTTIDITVV